MTQLDRRPGTGWRRVRRAALAGAVIAVTVLATACRPFAWTSGTTHGPVVELGASRAGINVYRLPTEALYQVYRAGGIDLVQDMLWQHGRPPLVRVPLGGGNAVSVDWLQAKFHGFIYGDDDDLAGAVRDAHDDGDCLSLTLISHGLYNKNWTHKSVGCKRGGFPR